MRIAATAATLLFALTACSTTESKVRPYQQPNSLMSTEIDQRIDQIQYQHREELLDNLLWLAQTGEQTIPALLRGLTNGSPKVRSSCCWVLGRIGDRRTVTDLQGLVDDRELRVRFEACRTLVLMGDLQQSPRLIEGLDSDRKEVRYMCHEALKTATGHDFGYDHLNQDQQELRLAVLLWRQWWGSYDGDTFFASSYEQKHGLNKLAAPGGETQLQDVNSATGESASGTAGGQNSESSNSAVITEPLIPSNNSAESVKVEIPPAVPPLQIEIIEIITEQVHTATGLNTESNTSSNTGANTGAGTGSNTGANTGAGTETTNNETNNPIPVVEGPPVTGSNGSGTSNENGGN